MSYVSQNYCHAPSILADNHFGSAYEAKIYPRNMEKLRHYNGSCVISIQSLLQHKDT